MNRLKEKKTPLEGFLSALMENSKDVCGAKIKRCGQGVWPPLRAYNHNKLSYVVMSHDKITNKDGEASILFQVATLYLAEGGNGGEKGCGV